jgi:hybrid cluster-associated redox disulfide protein
MPIEPTHLVDDVMRRRPATIRVFLANRMGCVGCPIGAFHTVADAAREHRLPLAPLLAALGEAAGEAPDASGGEGDAAQPA